MLKESARQEKAIDYDVVEIDAPAHPKNRLLLDYWRSNAGPDGVVRRSWVNPFDFRQILGGVFIVEPADDGADLFYRLVGSENEHRLNIKLTGRRFTECYGRRMASEQVAFHRRIFMAGRPAYLRGRLIGLNVEHASFEASYFPMKTDDGRDQMLGGFFDLSE